MLAGDFFTIPHLDSGENRAVADIAINAAHRIFEGHFPGQPVVPGVCMMQMIKDILEIVLKERTRLLRADHAKFLSVIDPRVHSNIRAEINYRDAGNCEIEVNASLLNDTTVFLKYKAVFLTIE